jgi:hypothetical protein
MSHAWTFFSTLCLCRIQHSQMFAVRPGSDASSSARSGRKWSLARKADSTITTTFAREKSANCLALQSGNNLPGDARDLRTRERREGDIAGGGRRRNCTGSPLSLAAAPSARKKSSVSFAPALAWGRAPQGAPVGHGGALE